MRTVLVRVLDNFRAVQTFNFFMLQSHDFFLRYLLCSAKVLPLLPSLDWVHWLSQGVVQTALHCIPFCTLWECVWWSATVIKVQERGETHHRARPLAERAQGNTTVLLKCSPPPIRLSQGQEHVHGAAGVGVQLTQGGCGLRQEVVELPDKHARHAGTTQMRVRHVCRSSVYTGSFPLSYVQA